MAEAAVEERPPNPRFFCHKCSVEFEHASPEYTCPHCLGGFIEELEANAEGADDVIDVEDDDDQYNPTWGNEMNAFLAELERQASRPRMSHDLSSRRRRALGTRIPGVRQPTPFHNLIQDFILNLGVGWGGPNQVAGNMLFLGNPGDYAWGREGLDAIVTQLLNQMDGTGPPPLSKEVIDTIPTVAITQEQVDAKVQCSVCWEDFVLNECVRKLPCQHVYHENCICPWLELHGTCPICRQNLTPGGENAQNQDRNNPNNTGNREVRNPRGFLGISRTRPISPEVNRFQRRGDGRYNRRFHNFHARRRPIPRVTFRQYSVDQGTHQNHGRNDRINISRPQICTNHQGRFQRNPQNRIAHSSVNRTCDHNHGRYSSCSFNHNPERFEQNHFDRTCASNFVGQPNESSIQNNRSFGPNVVDLSLNSSDQIVDQSQERPGQNNMDRPQNSGPRCTCNSANQPHELASTSSNQAFVRNIFDRTSSNVSSHNWTNPLFNPDQGLSERNNIEINYGPYSVNRVHDQNRFSDPRCIFNSTNQPHEPPTMSSNQAFGRNIVDSPRTPRSRPIYNFANPINLDQGQFERNNIAINDRPYSGNRVYDQNNMDGLYSRNYSSNVPQWRSNGHIEDGSHNLGNRFTYNPNGQMFYYGQEASTLEDYHSSQGRSNGNTQDGSRDMDYS